MHFQVILKPILPYSLTSILNQVRHSNTLFLTITFAFHCRPLGALVRFPCCCFFFCFFVVFFFLGGGGGQSNCNASLSKPNVQKNSRALVRGVGGLKT